MVAQISTVWSFVSLRADPIKTALRSLAARALGCKSDQCNVGVLLIMITVETCQSLERHLLVDKQVRGPAGQWGSGGTTGAALR